MRSLEENSKFLSNCSLQSILVLLAVLLLSTSSVLEAQELLPPAVVEDEAEAEQEVERGEYTVRTYDLSRVLDRIAFETGQSRDVSIQVVDEQVRKVLKLEDQDDRKAQPASVATNLGDVDLGLSEEGIGCRFIGERLVAVCHESEHVALQELLSTLQEYGLRQVVISTEVFRGPVGKVLQLGINWSHVEAASTIAQDADALREHSVVKAPNNIGLKLEASGSNGNKVVGANYIAYRELKEADELPRPISATGAYWTEATSIIERSNPVLYTLMNPDEVEAVTKAIKDDESIERIMSPTMIVFNGQVASVSDAVERPFVTGIQPVVAGPKETKLVQFQPKIRVYPDGTTMKIRPVLSGDSVDLGYELQISDIRKVETFEMPNVDGRSNFTVQIPEVASTKFHTRMKLPLHHSLAVSTFETNEDGEKTALIVVCHCSVDEFSKAKRKATGTPAKQQSE